MRPSFSDLNAFLIGCLCGVSFYVRVAAGDGIVPDVTANYSLCIMAASTVLSWMIVNSERRYDVFSAFIGIGFSVFCVASVFSIGFVVGLPGTNFVTMDLFIGWLAAPFVLGLIVVLRQFSLFRSLGIGFVAAFVFTVLVLQVAVRIFVGAHMQDTIKNGGCVIAFESEVSGSVDKHRKVERVLDVNFGIIIGRDSERVSFVSKNGSFEWSYGRFGLVESGVKGCPMASSFDADKAG
ncbi:MAG: hypothetical protein ACRCU5_16960 [Rhizobiaceae bacterium]